MRFTWMKRLMAYVSGVVAWNKQAVESFNPSNVGTTTHATIKKLIEAKGIKQYQIVDDKYYLLSKADMAEFLEYNFGRTRQYIWDKFDCDNYTGVLYGQAQFVLGNYAVGMIHVDTPNGKHALNCFVDKYRVLYYIEPQTNEIFSFTAGRRRGYVPYFILI